MFIVCYNNILVQNEVANNITYIATSSLFNFPLKVTLADRISGSPCGKVAEYCQGHNFTVMPPPL